jgi:hypothetical protein
MSLPMEAPLKTASSGTMASIAISKGLSSSIEAMICARSVIMASTAVRPATERHDMLALSRLECQK